MKNNSLNWNIEVINPKKLTESELLKMYEIERDTWSYFMWEYVRCKDCDEIFSKKDIYWEIDENYRDKTVVELEKEYGRKNIKCKCCEWETEDIRGEELIKALELRIFWVKQSFVNFYRWKVDEILGFSYGFIDTPEGVYEKEFKYHFTKKLLEAIKDKFWNTDLLTLSWVCFKEKEINITAIYELIKYFYCSVEPKWSDIDYTTIWEVIKWTPSYKIYTTLWWWPLENLRDNMFRDKDSIWVSEVIYKNNVINVFREIEKMDVRTFLKFIKKKVSNI